MIRSTHPSLYFASLALSLLLTSCAREEPPAEVVVDKAPTPFHRVERGETLSMIASKYSMSKESLIEVNRLKPPYKIFIGQKLIVLAGSHKSAVQKPSVKPVTSVADTGEVTVEELPPEEEKQGGAVPPLAGGTGAASAGMGLPTMGSGVIGSPTAPVNAPSNNTAMPMAETNDMVGTGPLPRETAPKIPQNTGTMKWPVQGRVVKSFGVDPKGQHNTGINIAAAAGTAVGAADQGVVAHVGNHARGFGNLVLIKHAGGKISVYGHLQDCSVKVGDTVAAGQKVGTVGTSGGVSEPQVHFEIRQNITPLDPTKYLQ